MIDPLWRTGRAALEVLALRPRLAMRRAMRDPAAAQESLRRQIVSTMRSTAYGRALGLRGDESYAAFARAVPIVSYDDLAPWIERQRATEQPQIVAGRVAFYEPTSGSSGPRKLIPYTRPLRRAFTNMFLLWAADIVRHGPKLHRGTMFVSISPTGDRESTARGVRVGASTDAEYLSRWTRPLVSRFFVMPPAIARLRGDDYYRASALHLLASDPEVISVWNPSMLLLLLEYIEAHRRELGRELARGTTAAGVWLRKRRVAEPLISAKLISCWGSAEAQPGFLALRRRFPQVFIQRKGLLATEAPITFPSLEAGGLLPLLNDVFLELESDDGSIARLHELECGREYGVVLSHAGGLLRYRLGDRVRVSHFAEQVPALDFVGRTDAVADLVGEKLHAGFVTSCMAGLGEAAGSAMLLPVRSGSPEGTAAGYLALSGSRDAFRLAELLEDALRRNPRYDEARDRGQLAPLRGLRVAGLEERYLRFFERKGMKRGDIKPRILWTDASAAAEFLQTLGDRDVSTVQ